jgi:excisionase family DNA binding protein
MTDEQLLSFEEAADVLNVRVEYVSHLAAEGRLRSIATPTGPAVVRAEFVAYKAEDVAYRDAIADELTQPSQDMGLYDSPGKTG